MTQQNQTSKSPKHKRNGDSQNPVSTFIRKTYNILEERKFPEVVDWNEEGTALVILKPKEFCSKVLPKYFKHNQLTSFVRQLNLYDFHKRRTLTTDHVYYHDMFQRGQKDLLKNIHRKNQDPTLLTLQKAIENTKSGENVQNSQGLNYENRMLLMMHKEALQRISSLDSKMRDLTIQNQALWNQISQQEERESILQNLVNSIITEFNIPADQIPSLVKDENRTAIGSPATNKSSAQPLNLSQNSRQNCPTCIDIGCFLDMEESCNSTENSSFPSPIPSSAADQSSFENEKSTTESKDGSSALIRKLLQEAAERSAQEKHREENKEEEYLSKNYKNNFHANQDWSLESEYLRKFANNKQQFEDLFGNKNGSGTPLNQQNILGKRGYDLYLTSFMQQANEPEQDLINKMELPRKI